MKKIIFSLFIILPGINVFAQQQTRFDLLPYASYINYNNAVIKNSSIIGGIYGYYGIGLKHNIEADAAYNRIDFDEFVYEIEGREYRSEPFSINQADITLAYSNYTLKNLKWRIGSHAIFNDDSFNDKAFIVFGGLQRYRLYQYNAGIDVYASWYNNFVPELNVLQVSGTFGFYVGNYFTSGNFYAETKGHYIKLSEDIGFGNTQYASVEQSLSYFYKNLTLSGFFRVGYQVFGIQKDGFVVYNLAEKHLGAYGGYIKFGLSKKSSLKLEVAQGRFKEFGSDQVANYLKFLAVAGITL
jgi:hypothetical protein